MAERNGSNQEFVVISDHLAVLTEFLSISSSLLSLGAIRPPITRADTLDAPWKLMTNLLNFRPTIFGDQSNTHDACNQNKLQASKINQAINPVID